MVFGQMFITYWSFGHWNWCLQYFLILFMSYADVGGQHCPDSVLIYCEVSVGQNQVQTRNSDTQKPSRLKISDFDWQAPHSKSGQDPDVCYLGSWQAASPRICVFENFWWKANIFTRNGVFWYLNRKKW